MPGTEAQRRAALRQIALMAASVVVSKRPEEVRAMVATSLDLVAQVRTLLSNSLYAPSLQGLKVLTEQDARAGVNLLRSILPPEYAGVVDEHRGWLEQQFKTALQAIKRG